MLSVAGEFVAIGRVVVEHQQWIAGLRHQRPGSRLARSKGQVAGGPNRKRLALRTSSVVEYGPGRRHGTCWGAKHGPRHRGPRLTALARGAQHPHSRTVKPKHGPPGPPSKGPDATLSSKGSRDSAAAWAVAISAESVPEETMYLAITDMKTGYDDHICCRGVRTLVDATQCVQLD